MRQSTQIGGSTHQNLPKKCHSDRSPYSEQWQEHLQPLERVEKVGPTWRSSVRNRGGRLHSGPAARSVWQVFVLFFVRQKCSVSALGMKVALCFICGLAKKINVA